jgi:hypothetical protein
MSDTDDGGPASVPPSAVGPAGDAPPPAKLQQPPQCTLCAATVLIYAEIAQSPKTTTNPRAKHLTLENTNKKWRHIGNNTGPITLNVSFLNGKQATREKVMKYAMEWSKFSGHAGADHGANVEF